MEGVLQYNGQDLEFNGQVITFQGAPQPPQEQDDPRFLAWATPTELGKHRFHRLRLLGYI